MADQQKLMAHFEATCRAHGLKITHQRLEIYRMLVQSPEHPSAETLHKLLIERMPTLSLDTVYRTLATFEDLGLVKRVETMSSQARFEAKIEQHHHFFCDQCGQLIDFCWHSFDSMGLPDGLQGVGVIRDKNVVVHGVCRQCLTSRENGG
jgi:Fur family peroxide stress response transcriptional regulator